MSNRENRIRLESSGV